MDKDKPIHESQQDEFEIFELEERLDMAIDPFGVNFGCPNTNCSGGNCVAGCGG